jgi:hypothetical protein
LAPLPGFLVPCLRSYRVLAYLGASLDGNQLITFQKNSERRAPRQDQTPPLSEMKQKVEDKDPKEENPKRARVAERKEASKPSKTTSSSCNVILNAPHPVHGMTAIIFKT